MKTCCFIGHSQIEEKDLAKRVREKIEMCIALGVTEFLSGGMGMFDRLSAKTVFEMKSKYPYIKNILVIPCLDYHNYNSSIFDEVIYPDLEYYYFKKAIIMRNQYLVEHSQYAICYVKYSYGGAIQTYQYAKRKGLYLFNLAE